MKITIIILGLIYMTSTIGAQGTNNDKQETKGVTTRDDVKTQSDIGLLVGNPILNGMTTIPTGEQVKKPKKNKNKKNKNKKKKNKTTLLPNSSSTAPLIINSTRNILGKDTTTPLNKDLTTPFDKDLNTPFDNDVLSSHVPTTTEQIPQGHICTCGKQDEVVYEMFSIWFEPQTLFVEEGETKSVNMTISGINGNIEISLASSNEDAFQLVSNSTFLVESSSEKDNITIPIRISGVRVNIAHMEIYTDAPTKQQQQQQPPAFRVKTLRHLRVIDKIFDYILLPLLIITTTGMGCKMEFDIIKYKLKHPFPIIIGPVCQFICQPFYAFSIAKLLNLTPLMAVGLVTVGSCPGGGLSNMITLLVDADLIQSVTMTFVSSCLAMGMLPLNMFIYVRAFVDGDGGGNGGVPFAEIMVQVSMLTIPVLTGMFIRHKFPKIAYYCIKSLNVLSVTLILMTIGIGLYSNVYVIYSPWYCFLGSLMLPSCGFITGYLVARKIGKLPKDSSATVSIETGVQNNLIAIAMIKLSYEQPEADLMARMPIFVLIFSVSIGIGMIIASIPINRKRRVKKKQAKEMKELDNKYDKYDEYSAVPTKDRNGNTHAVRDGSIDEGDEVDTSLFSTTEQVSKTTNV